MLLIIYVAVLSTHSLFQRLSEITERHNSSDVFERLTSKQTSKTYI
jgi:hypothetical protein